MSRYLVLIFASLLLISCSKKMDNPVSPDQTDKSGLGKVSFSMSIPVKQIKAQYGFSIDSVTVRLQGPTNISGKLALSSDTTTATGTFSNLATGNYLISVAMFSGGDTIATGSGTATVLPGQQAVANITLSFLGSLIINVTLPSTLPADGLIAYYPFNGNAYDASGNNNNGTNIGAILTADRFGHSNSAYWFTNCSSITIPEMLSDSCSAFTFTAWVKQDYKDNNNHMIIFHGSIKGEAGLSITNGNVGFGMNLHVPGTPDNTQNWYAAQISDTLKANTYYFLVGRYIKGQRVDLMINGSLVASSVVPNLNLNTNPTRSYSAIGIHTQASFTQICCWNGDLDDIRIYNRAISDDEVQSLYHEGGWNGN